MTSNGSVHARFDQQQHADLVERFERFFSRSPSKTDLARLRRGEAALHLRLPARTKRRLATFITSA